MYQYKCLNPIAQVGLDSFTAEYTQTEDLNQADAILVRSANMHNMELPENVQAIARAGAGVNNTDVLDRQGDLPQNCIGAMFIIELGAVSNLILRKMSPV